MLKKLKGYMMPIAMTLGIILHKYVGELSFIIPYLIFVMLLLTYVNYHGKRLDLQKCIYGLFLFK